MSVSVAERGRTRARLAREHEHVEEKTALGGFIATELYSSCLGLVVLGLNEEYLAHPNRQTFSNPVGFVAMLQWDGIGSGRRESSTAPASSLATFKSTAAQTPRSLP